MTASAAGSGGAVCPSTAAGGAVIFLCTAAPAAGSGVFCARRLLQLGQSLLVLRLRCLLELVVRLLLLRCMVCLALPAVPGVAWRPWCAWCAWRAWLAWCAWRAWRAWCAWRAWSYALSGDFLSSGCRRRSASGGFDWRDCGSGGGPLRLWPLLVGREVLPVFLGSRFWARCFFHPLLVAPSLEAPQLGSSCRFG